MKAKKLVWCDKLKEYAIHFKSGFGYTAEKPAECYFNKDGQCMKGRGWATGKSPKPCIGVGGEFRPKEERGSALDFGEMPEPAHVEYKKPFTPNEKGR